MGETKRQDLPAGLWVVATPLGNLGDLSERARAALATADRVLCEDTRRTARLCAAVGIQPSLERLDAYAKTADIRRAVERLQAGQSFALVSDAGTPAISDPGSRLVEAAHEAGIRVTPVPGPSAVTALLSVSGFEATTFAFRGFFPRKLSERKEELRMASESALPIFVWFESPNRIAEVLAFVAERFGGNRSVRMVAAKELTKVHERFFIGSPEEVANEVEGEIAREGALGEWCFAVQFSEKSEENFQARNTGQSSEWVKALQCLLDVPVSPSEAAKRVSQVFGVDRKTVYQRALALAGKK